MKKSRSESSDGMRWSDETVEARAARRFEVPCTKTYVYRTWIHVVLQVALMVFIICVLYAVVQACTGWTYQANKTEEAQPYTKGILYGIAYEIGRGWQTGVDDALQKDERDNTISRHGEADH